MFRPFLFVSASIPHDRMVYMRLFFFHLLLAVLCVYSFAAHAQTNSDPEQQAQRYRYNLQQKSTTVRPRYDFMVRQAIERRPGDFDFGKLRYLYSEIDEYDPEGRRVTASLMRLSERVRLGDEDAVEAYGALVAAHLGNLDMINQIYALSLDDPRFGDPAFYNWLREGVIKSVMYSGDGKSLVTAFDIVTAAEEAELLAGLGVQVEETLPRRSGQVFYNMHDVYDPALDQRYSIFVNTSAPLSRLENR